MTDRPVCGAALNIKGEHFQCDQLESMTTLDGSPPVSHDGWAHSNRDAQAIWQGEERVCCDEYGICADHGRKHWRIGRLVWFR